jgi:hypothetical protein
MECRLIDFDDGIVEATERLQSVINSNYKVQVKLAKVRKQYFALQSQVICGLYEDMIRYRPSNDLGQDGVESLNAIHRQIDKILAGIRDYRTKMPELMEKIMKLLKTMVKAKTEQAKDIGVQVRDEMLRMADLHNKQAALVRLDPKQGHYLILDPKDPSGGAMVVVEGEMRRRGVTETRQVRGATNFPSGKFDLSDQDWCDFYNRVISFVHPISDLEKPRW